MPATSWKNLVSGDDLEEAFKNRGKKILKEKITADLVDKYEKEGYQIIRQSKNGVWVQKKKSYSQLFEDKVWQCFEKLGFSYMNANDEFGIPYTDDVDIHPKQIDVFAYDGKVALIIECKSADCSDEDEVRQKSFKNDLEQIKSKMTYQTEAVRKYFNNPHIQVGFAIFSRKYTIGEADFRIATDMGIALIDDCNIKYYNDLYKTLGTYARYQVLCDVFRGSKIPSLEVSVNAIRCPYNDSYMYTFMIHPSQLLPISFVAHRDLNNKYIDDSYQRMINKNRIMEIKEYIKKGNKFANNVIVNINSDNDLIFETNDEGDIQSGILHLPPYYKSVWVIDGQHRLYSYVDLKEGEVDAIPVTAFVNLDKRLQSRIFVDINSKQKKVDPSHLVDINRDSLYQSSDECDWVIAMNTQIFVEMSKKEKGPLYGRLKDMTDPQSRGEITTVSLQNAMETCKIIGSVLKGNKFRPGPLFSEKDNSKENTHNRAIRFFELSFKTISEKCPELWSKRKDEGGYLCTPNGITSLIYTLNEMLYIAYDKVDDIMSASIESVYAKIKGYVETLATAFNEMSEEDIKFYKTQQGAPGQIRCHKEMLVLINKKYPEFTNQKIKEYIAASDMKYTTEVQKSLPILEKEIVDILKDSLLDIYGPDWHKRDEYKGIGNELVTNRYNSNDPETTPLENYVTLELAYRIIQNCNWNDMGKIFGIKSLTGSKSQRDRLYWIDLLKKYHKKIDTGDKIMLDEYERFTKIDMELHRNFQTALISDGTESIDQSY